MSNAALEDGVNNPVLDALIELCRAVSEHPDSMCNGAPLNGPFLKAMGVVLAHRAAPRELTNVTERSIDLPENRCRHGVWAADHCWECEKCKS